MAPPTGRPIIAGLDVGRLLTVSRNTHENCLSYQGTEYPLNIEVFQNQVLDLI